MSKTVNKILIWSASIIGISIIGFMGYILYYIYNGCGMDDGPFEAILIDQIELTGKAQQFNLSNNGKLILENRNDTLSPIITLIENGQVKWTLDTDTRNTKGYESTTIWEINNLTITRNTNPIKFRFTGHWTYGAEAGFMKINRENGKNSFCLSW